MYSVNDIWFFIICVPTFRNLRIEAYLQLPAAYRSLSRLSSAPDAKAFPLCSFLLELLLSCISTRSVSLFSLSRIAEYIKTVLVCFTFLAISTITCAALNCNFFTLNLNLNLERPIWFQILSFSLLINFTSLNFLFFVFSLIIYTSSLFGFQWTFCLNLTFIKFLKYSISIKHFKNLTNPVGFLL